MLSLIPLYCSNKSNVTASRPLQIKCKSTIDKNWMHSTNYEWQLFICSSKFWQVCLWSWKTFSPSVSLSRLLWQLLPRLYLQDEKKCVEKHWKFAQPGNRWRLQHQSCCVSEKKQTIINYTWWLFRAFRGFSLDFSTTNFQSVQVSDEEEADAARAAESLCKSRWALGKAADPAVAARAVKNCGDEQSLTTSHEEAP